MFENFRKHLEKAVSELLVSAKADPGGAKTILQKMHAEDPGLHKKVAAEIAGRVDPLAAASQWVTLVQAGDAAESYRVWTSLNAHNPEAAALALAQARSLPQFGAFQKYTIAQSADQVIGDLTNSNHDAAVDALVALNERDPESAQEVYTLACAQFPNMLPGLVRKRDKEAFMAASVGDAVAQIQTCTPANEEFGVQLVRAKSEQDPDFAVALAKDFYANGMATASADDVVEIITAGALHLEGAENEAADAVNRRYIELAQTDPTSAVLILSAVAASSTEVVDTMAAGVWSHLSDEQKAAYETAFAALNRAECESLVTRCAEQPDSAFEAIHAAVGGDVEAMKRIALEVAEIDGSDVARRALEQLITKGERTAATALPRKPKKPAGTSASAGDTGSALMLLLDSPIDSVTAMEDEYDKDDDDDDDADDDDEIEIVEAKVKGEGKKEWVPPWLDKDGDGDVDKDDEKIKDKKKKDSDDEDKKVKGKNGKKKVDTASANQTVYAPVVSASADVNPDNLRLFLVDDTPKNAQYAIYVGDRPLGRLRLATALADPDRSYNTFVSDTFGAHQIDAIRQTGWADYAQAMKVEPYADGTTRQELLQAAAKEQEPVLAVAAAERVAARGKRLEECRQVVLAGYDADYYTANPLVTALAKVLRGVGHTDPDSTARQLFLEAGADGLRAVEDEAQRLAAQPDEVVAEACHQIQKRGTAAPKVTTTATAGIQIQVPRTAHNVPFRTSQTAGGVVRANAGNTDEPTPYWEV